MFWQEKLQSNLNFGDADVAGGVTAFAFVYLQVTHCCNKDLMFGLPRINQYLLRKKFKVLLTPLKTSI